MRYIFIFEYFLSEKYIQGLPDNKIGLILTLDFTRFTSFNTVLLRQKYIVWKFLVSHSRVNKTKSNEWEEMYKGEKSSDSIN